MPYDPTLYRGSAAYYTRGRPPYSRSLAPTLAAELDLDGLGRFLDIGCGPGTITMALANHFEGVIGLDPDMEMLAAAADRTIAANNIRWVQALAEDIPDFNLGGFRLVSFGQSFHWTERERVAEAVFEILEPGGALVLIGHAHEGRPQPTGPGYPPIPHDAIRALISRYLGMRRRAGQGYFSPPADRHEDVLARTRFGKPRRIFCEGRADIVQDIDGVLANYLSTSFAAPHLFGERLPAFEDVFRAELAAHSPSGLFWDWPGDTEILLARKPD
jgi:SAM-dependent methyltransferase